MPEMMQDLMEQQPIQPQAGQQSIQPNDGQSPGFTIDANQIEDTIKKHLEPKQIPALDRVVKAGHELMFGKDTHNKIMDGLEGSKDIGGDLGKGAFHMMLLLLKQSGNTIPGEIIIPVGIILLARAGEFFKESGIPITDDDFEEAVHVFSTMTMNKLDPEFKAKMEQHSGQQQAAMPDQQIRPQGNMHQAGGLLMTGQAGV